MTKATKQIKWRVCGHNGWERKGSLGAYEIHIEYCYGKKSYELRFGSVHHGSYGTSDDEMARAKAEAEQMLPGWIAELQAARQARKDAEIEASRIAAEQTARRVAVAARLRALGVPCNDSIGITLTTDAAEALADRLDSAPTLAILQSGDIGP